MIQQDHLQIFDLTLNVWAPLFVGNGSSYTKKELHWLILREALI